MRASASVIFGLILGLAIAACGPSRRGHGDDGTCVDGERACDGLTLQNCVDGQFEDSETCDLACSPDLGCVQCNPGYGTCNGNVSHYCLPDGSGYADETCDESIGVVCNVDTGRCDGPCAPENLGDSYIGCDYYAVVSGNAVGNMFNFAVAISNTSGYTANVTIDGGALTNAVTLQVPAGSVATQNLPWIHDLKLCTGPSSYDCLTPQVYGANVARGGYHLKSTVPVTVYQFSPLEYFNGIDYSYSNDASLLVPTNAWSGSYMVATWQKFDANAPDTWPGFMVITASQDGTDVTITTTAATNAATNLPPFGIGTSQTITINAGDTMELASFGTYGDGIPGNLTGSTVQASRPVQVLAGHYCTYIPDLGTGACDHLEESMLPIEALSSRYLLTAPACVGGQTKRHLVRIVATQANTNLVFDPPMGAPTTIPNAGGYIDVPLSNTDFLVDADHKILVAQFMEGQDFITNTGDPAMATAVPIEQYRTSYLFHAPTNYESNFVNITAPAGAAVVLDGTPVSGFIPIGGSGFGISRQPLASINGGNHNITSDLPVGISVMGYGQYTSYWYPGGLDLTDIPIE
jgi:hypothetical protein